MLPRHARPAPPARALRRRLVLGLVLGLALVALPVTPVTAQPTPDVHSAVVDDLADRLGPVGPGEAGAGHEAHAHAGADEPAEDDVARAGEATGDADAEWRTTGPVEAPLAFSAFVVRGDGDEPALEVRSRATDGEWSAWTPVEVIDDHGPDADAPEGAADGPAGADWSTDAIWAGPSEQVEVRVADQQPDRLDVVFYDSAGLSESAFTRAVRWLGSLGTHQPAEASHGAPEIRTRAQWGANESWRAEEPHVERDVKMAILHHTETTNGYGSRADAERHIRSIYRFHTDPNNGRGWDDIGYNFLVDKFGNIYEGRAGSIERGIQGAHAAGWNAGSIGVAVLGSHTSYAPRQASLDAIVRLLDWQYAVHDVERDANATVRHDGETAPVLQGHRDVGQTSCPGAELYAKLAGLRTRIDAEASGYPVRMFPDVAHDHRFRTEIEWAAEDGLTDGFPNGTFGPGRKVTRQAMAAYLYRLADEPDHAVDDPGFDDVDEGHAFYDAIAWAADADIVEGYADDTFRPAAAVKRQAAAAFLHRYAGEPAPRGSSAFDDVDRGHTFHDAITWAAEKDVVDGYDDDTFRPIRRVARQASAAFLHRMDRAGLG